MTVPQEIEDFLLKVIRGEEQAHLSERVRACDLLGRRYGMWTGGTVELPDVLIVSGGDDLAE